MIDNPTEIERSDIDLVVRTLKGANAYTFLTGVEGEDRFGTAPVRDSYFALGHTDLIGQLDNVQGFVYKWNYPNQQSTLKISGVYKLPLIDSEVRRDDEAQAA